MASWLSRKKRLDQAWWDGRPGRDTMVQEGVAYADMLRANSIQTYSAKGVGYAVEKAGNTVVRSYTMYEEILFYGFPQEFAHILLTA